MTMNVNAALYDITGDGDPDGMAMLDGIIDDLAPLFTPDPAQRDAGRRMALRAVLRHQPACEADFLSAAQAVAHGRISLTLLRDAADPAVHPAERRQLVSQSQQASRTATQIETAMQRRRKLRQGAPAPADARAASEPASAPPPPDRQQPATPALAPSPPSDPAPAASRDPRIHAMTQVAEMIMAEAALRSGDPAARSPAAPDGIPPHGLEQLLAPWIAIEAGGGMDRAGPGDFPPVAGAAD
ncbi:MAG: hypothetical protein JSS43_12340 [Proteobacteria bacterium]|nr:hypothetical protein [Pseudomonadota bacterium]